MNFVNFVGVHKKGVLNLCFYDKFKGLCTLRNETESRALINAGLSKSLLSKWRAKPDTVPNGKTLAKLCDHFGVPASYFLGEKEKAPTLTSEDLHQILNGMSNAELIELISEATEKLKGN